MARTGRRPGGSGEARAAILTAARSSFAERGYDATTLRGIARDAEVDPSLVHHYWPGGKDAVFVEALQLPVDPSTVVPAVLAGGVDGLGERLVRLFLGLWEAPHSREPLLALVRGAVSNDAAAALLRGFITRQVVKRVARELAVPDAELRATLVGSQMVGLVVVRYVVKVEPLASAPPETVVAWAAPTVQRYLTGTLAPLDDGIHQA